MAEDVDLDDEPLSPPTPSCRVVAAPPVGERILVKHPLGAHPIEMWITVPDLDVRPPEVVACFCAQLRVTAAAGSRRWLDASKLMLVDGGGDTLSVSASLRASRVRYGDALVLLPSLRRLRFLRAELASRVAELADCDIEVEDAPAAADGDAPAGPGGARDDPAPGDACWVRRDDATWRKGTVELWPKDANAHAVVKWDPASLAMDEAPLAQVGRGAVSATAPAAMLGAPPALAEAPPRKPRASRDDGSLRVQVVWRLGDPAEALAVWLTVRPPHGGAVKPGRLLASFAARLADERPRLRWRVRAESLCLATLDGAPLDGGVAVEASLRALVARRACAAPAGGGDDMARHWAAHGEDAEDTLLVLPRLRGLEPKKTFARRAAPRAAARREGWIVEADGALTACALPRGRGAPARNKLARGGPVDEDRATAELSASSAGDTVLVETDRRTAGAARYRQVKLSQIVFADDLARGAGKPPPPPRGAGGVAPAWYDEAAAARDLGAIGEVRARLALMDVLPEFRRNGKLLRRPTGRARGESYDVVFPHASLGIALALALDDGGHQVVALDAKGPSLHPAAQLACDVGDALVAVDGAAVDATEAGYQEAVARLRCGARPTTLTFAKRRDDPGAGASTAAAPAHRPLSATVVASPAAEAALDMDVDVDLDAVRELHGPMDEDEDLEPVPPLLDRADVDAGDVVDLDTAHVVDLDGDDDDDDEPVAAADETPEAMPVVARDSVATRSDDGSPRRPPYRATPRPVGAPPADGGPLLAAPAEANVVFKVSGRDGGYRACVLDDGTVKNNRGAVLGYLNDDDHQAGSVDEQFLGDLTFESALRDAMVARGAADELVATLRLDAARLVDGGGSTLACVSRDGEITGGLGERLGVVEPFDFSLQTQVALYALFLDPGLLSSEEE